MAKLDEYAQNNLKEFLRVIQPWAEAYKDATFGFVGIRNGEWIDILYGHLALPNSNIKISPRHIETNSIVGRLFRLEEINENYDSFLNKLCTGALNTPYGNIRLTSNSNNDNASAHFSPYESGFESGQPRINKLLIRGNIGNSDLVNSATLELKSAAAPYDSLEELASELSIVNTERTYTIVEVTANNVAMIDQARRIQGEEADIAILLSPYLDTAHCSLGYKIVQRGAVIERSRLSGSELFWEKRQDHWIGSKKINTPPGAVLQCFASYKEHIQHHYWISDPDTFPNYFRVLHHGFDPDLEILKTYLFDENHHQRFSRDFEAGISNLLFMLGFSVNPLVGKPLEDNPDIIATTKNGNILVIECTTNQINKDGKLGKLVDRAEMVKAHLQKSAFDPKVIPVIVTSKSRNAVVDTELANKSGVIVLTKEDLETAVERTFVYQDPDKLFIELWRRMQRLLTPSSAALLPYPASTIV
jgi:hypothetical protein